jgi:hypothetical protein
MSAAPTATQASQLQNPKSSCWPSSRTSAELDLEFAGFDAGLQVLVEQRELHGGQLE